MRCRNSIVIVLTLVAIGAAIPHGSVLAIQPDAPFLELAKKERQKWIAEDQQINAKLAALHKRLFQPIGTKPTTQFSQ